MSKLTELQAVEINILKEFKRVAEREGLKWFVMFGTLLGAVRQKGFIPWDDDIDIAMPRSEYDRLRHSCGWFDEPYFLQTPHNDPAAASPFMRLRRTDTAVLINFPNIMTLGGNMGACIDILPLDDVPDGFVSRRMSQTANYIRRQIFASAALDECTDADTPDFKRHRCYGMGGIEGYCRIFADRYEAYCSQHTGMLYYAIPVLSSDRASKVYEKAWFAKSIEMEFEGITVPTPIGYKEVLIVSYPEGIYEPELRYRKSKYNNDCIIDMHRSYKEYIKRYADMLKDIEGKKIFLFGAGDSLRIWLERYGEDLEVVCTFDNSKSKWGNTVYGVLVRSPSDIKELADENSRIIITSIYHKEIAVQLEEMGILDYYIFIDGLKY